MTDEKEKNSKQTGKRSGVSRREFIAGTVGGVVVGAVVGAAAGSLGFPKTVTQTTTQTATETTVTTATVTAQPWLPAKWDQTADVVVVGYGGAGAVAAVTAYDAGANVLILEKSPSWASLGFTPPSTSSNLTGGGGSSCMAASGSHVVTDPVAGAQYIYLQSWGNTPMSVCQALASMEVGVPAWLTKMGITNSTSASTAEFPTIPGASAFASLNIGTGYQLFTALDALVKKRNIPVLCATPATSLIQNANTKEILGVVATASNGTLNIRANKAVVLTTGSIEFNEDMKCMNYRCYPAHHYGWPYSTGDSVTMASKVGAAMWHMGVMSSRMVPWFPDYTMAFGTCAPSQNGWIYVDKHGYRYADETQLSTYSHNWWLKLSDFDLTEPGYTRIPSFIIFDETCRKAGAITSGSTPGNLPPQIDPRPVWSKDNSVEISKGWIQQGSDIPSLAAAMNATTYHGLDPNSTNASLAAQVNVKIDPNVLNATVNAYNAACAAKSDSQFGRKASTLVPVQTPPFYAMPLWPGGPSAYGGPVRNLKGQVCDASNNPIPRLYSAGENGSCDGECTLGANVAQFIAFGQISGTNAAAETPWS